MAPSGNERGKEAKTGSVGDGAGEKSPAQVEKICADDNDTIIWESHEVRTTKVHSKISGFFCFPEISVSTKFLILIK